jgi:hypothetical protein
MYNFAGKTQSLWFLAYVSALFLAILGLLKAFDVITFQLTLDKVLLYSGLLFALGAGFGLSSLESGERNLFWKWKILWLLLMLTGLVLTLSGIVAYFMDGQELFNQNWNVLFVVGVPFLAYGTILFFSGMSESTRDSFGKLWILYLLFFLVGFLSGLFGFILFFLSEGGRTEVVSSLSWTVLTDIGIVFGILSVIPFSYVMGAKESQKEKFHKFLILWIILALSGFVVFVLTLVEVLANMDIIGGSAHREGGLILGLALQAPGFIFLLSSVDKDDLIKKLSPLYVLLLVVGIVLAFASDLVSSLVVSTLGIGVAVVIIASGLIYKAISVDFVPSGTSQPMARVSRTTAPVGTTSKAGFEIPNDLPPEEKKYYIDMQRKTNENWIVSLNNAAKQNRLSKDFVARKTQELSSTNAEAESLISNILEQAKRSSRQSIFEQAMGTEPTPTQPSSPPQQAAPVQAKQAPPMSPPGPPSSPPPPMSKPPSPPPASSGPPMPPSSGAPKPPMPPSGGAPPMPPSSNSPPPPPGASGPPKPPGMPPMPPGGSAPAPPGFGSSAGGPPKPPGMPPMPSSSAPPVPGGASQPAKPPGAPGGDAVGTARSTSIAELRGEMLKELRRLRDIFNEDGK